MGGLNGGNRDLIEPTKVFNLGGSFLLLKGNNFYTESETSVKGFSSGFYTYSG